MLIALRIALYIQVLLGLGRFFGFIANQRLWETHISLGVLIAVLALLAMRPHPKAGNDAVRVLARFMPLITLFVGLGLWQDVFVGRFAVMIHMLLGLISVGLVERAGAQERRAAAGRAG
ncbi:MAG: hypothetical protein H0Z37_03790 [Firmicutes bacterium]|nr:hypothetical protein [Bacillota bacterium]